MGSTMRCAIVVGLVVTCGCGGSPPPESSQPRDVTVEAPPADGELADESESEPERTEPAERDEAVERPSPTAASGPDAELYDRAMQHLHAGDKDEARKLLYELIRQFPSSALVPHAYLAFGEMFFDEAASDPSKLSVARQLYEKVLAYPPPGNEVYGYAQYKLGWVALNAGDHARSMQRFADVIETARRYPEMRGVAQLARQATKDIVLPYGHAGRPDKAFAFFSKVAGNPRDALAMLLRLARTYEDQGKPLDAAAAYAELVKRETDRGERCEHQRALVRAVIAGGKSAAAERRREAQLCR